MVSAMAIQGSVSARLAVIARRSSSVELSTAHAVQHPLPPEGPGGGMSMGRRRSMLRQESWADLQAIEAFKQAAVDTVGPVRMEGISEDEGDEAANHAMHG